MQELRHKLRERVEEIDRESGVVMEQNNEVVVEQPIGGVGPVNPVRHPMTMSDYARPYLMGIVRPAVVANNFEIKPNVIQMVQ